MRIILEGPIGAGKTTLGNALSEITGVPLYRPFRSSGTHITQHQMDYIRQDIGLSINGWEEDLYVADVLAALSASALLDRSMPSAMAYNEMSDRALEARARLGVVRLWAQRIADACGILVLVSASPETRERRAGARFISWEAPSIDRYVDMVIQMKCAIPVWEVDTDDANPVELALAIARRAEFGVQSPLVRTVHEPGAPAAQIFV